MKLNKRPDRMWELIWFNYIANETLTALIKADTKYEALQVAELYIKSSVGKNSFPSAMESLREYSMDNLNILTKEDMINRYKRCYNGEEPEYTDYMKAYLYDEEEEAEDREIEKLIEEAMNNGNSEGCSEQEDKEE